ncbi:type II secretion system protein [Prosthecobacter vanneervenii]|uniref:Prepilin-type N-terminal cleavage/methylation domain-containing protein n=1 Tax=Prosthecobacter vanneervenii TaxID=48466 RepID=A0A7W7Y909_9BACT|nr:prepilin-type N-terminal cleavage/methylation domain-containing protein [Prosthecobacter vanneervenii]MBB5031749.1 prepilin-type N-terminal cleavage/methylation domain-containing protein [Prosthecobacter vanneervenii]
MATSRRQHGFSFVEAIFTIAIIGIMSSIVVAAISNAARDSYRVLSRQQQASLQSAVTAWVMAQTRVNSTSAQFQSLENIRARYNSAGNSLGRFNLLVPTPGAADPIQRAGFVDQTTADQFLSYSSGGQLQTEALVNSQQYITLPDWQSDDFPRVNLVTQ